MSVPRVEKSLQADEDLIEIWCHIAKDNEEAADRVFDYLRDRCENLAHSPALGRARDDLSPGMRCFVVGKSKWRSRYGVYYFPTDYGINVARVLETSRDVRAEDMRSS